MAGVVHWDTSAIVSASFQDRYSRGRPVRPQQPRVIPRLGEVYAIIARIEREHALSPVLIAAAREALEHGPWTVSASIRTGYNLQHLHLRGADLWHLAAAKALQADLPELRLLSFDTRLAEAARGEGFP